MCPFFHNQSGCKKRNKGCVLIITLTKNHELSTMPWIVRAKRVSFRFERNILLRFYLLNTFKYKFVNCKPSKHKYMFSLTLKLFINRTTFVSLVTLKRCNNIITTTGWQLVRHNYSLFCLPPQLLELRTQLVTRLPELRLTD